MIRGGIYALLATCALIFTLAAIGTSICSFGTRGLLNNGQATQDVQRDVTLWYDCGRQGATNPNFCNPHQDHACSSLRSRMQAAEAFYVLTAITLALSILFAVFDHGNVHGVKFYKLILLLLALLTFIFSIIGWAIAISVPRKDHCGHPAWVSQPQYYWGPSPFLLLIATLFAIPMFLVAKHAPFAATEHVSPHKEPRTSTMHPPVAADPHATTHIGHAANAPVASHGTAAPYGTTTTGAHPTTV